MCLCAYAPHPLRHQSECSVPFRHLYRCRSPHILSMLDILFPCKGRRSKGGWCWWGGGQRGRAAGCVLLQGGGCWLGSSFADGLRAALHLPSGAASAGRQNLTWSRKGHTARRVGGSTGGKPPKRRRRVQAPWLAPSVPPPPSAPAPSPRRAGGDLMMSSPRCTYVLRSYLLHIHNITIRTHRSFLSTRTKNARAASQRA